MDKASTSASPRRWLAALTGALALGLLPAARGQALDPIIDQLISKGVLTVDEANGLKEEADRGFTQAYAVHSGMPEWVNALVISGDLLTRFDTISSENPTFDRETFFSYRVRLGFTAVIQHDFEVGFQLASGNLDNAANIRYGANPINEQQNFQNNASKKGVFINLAYLKWSPIHTPDFAGSFTVGKMQNPFEYSSLIFDPDYTPEGFAHTLAYTINDHQSLRMHLGALILDQFGTLGELDKAPLLLGAQGIHEIQWSRKLSTSLGLGWLSITHHEYLAPQLGEDGLPIPGTGTALINGGNLRYLDDIGVNGIGKTVYGFNALTFDFGATYALSTFPLYPGAFPVRGFTELIHNTSADNDYSNAYEVGVQLGKAGRKGTWQISYAYRVSGGDAWWDQLTDSDFGAYYQGPRPPNVTTTRSTTSSASGAALDAPIVRGRGYQAGTNVRGNIISASYSPYDMLTLNVTVYLTSLIQALPSGSQSATARVQLNAGIIF